MHISVLLAIPALICYDYHLGFAPNDDIVPHPCDTGKFISQDLTYLDPNGTENSFGRGVTHAAYLPAVSMVRE